MELIIDGEFENLLPKESDDYLWQVERDCQKYGFINPIHVWGNTVIKGGYLYEIATKNNIPFEKSICSHDFKNVDEAKAWVILNELSRNHLCAFSRAVLVIQNEDIIARQVKADKTADKKYTDERLAEIAKVSVGNIFKVRKILSLVDDETKNKLEKEELTINKVFNSLPKERTAISTQKQASFNVIVVCENEIEQEQTYNKLCAEGFKCKLSA